nr:hypothetical protein [Catellatospora vulcania]
MFKRYPNLRIALRPGVSFGDCAQAALLTIIASLNKPPSGQLPRGLSGDNFCGNRNSGRR